MTTQLTIKTLEAIREACRADHMDTETEALDLALWAIQTQDALRKERDAAIEELEQSEIIRCKDCVWNRVCRVGQDLGLNGYCSKAERRKDGSD